MFEGTELSFCEVSQDGLSKYFKCDAIIRDGRLSTSRMVCVNGIANY